MVSLQQQQLCEEQPAVCDLLWWENNIKAGKYEQEQIGLSLNLKGEREWMTGTRRGPEGKGLNGWSNDKQRAVWSRWTGERTGRREEEQMDRWVICGTKGIEVLQRAEEVLREDVYRRWFINSRAVSKSSRSSEPLWIGAQKEVKCNNLSTKPVNVSDTNQSISFKCDFLLRAASFSAPERKRWWSSTSECGFNSTDGA